MQNEAALTTTLAVGFVLAFALGALAHRLRMPPMAGYLAAGVAIGPYTPGFVADQAIGAQLADIGVALLMFGVGLQFSPRDLMSVRALAVPGTFLQIALAAPLGAALGLVLGWPLGGAALFGFALTIASTVVLLKSLQDRRLIETERGRLTVGWAVAEDLVTVLALVLIPALAALTGPNGAGPARAPLVNLLGLELGIFGVLAMTAAQIAAFIATMLILGKRLIPWALHWVAQLGSRELFRLAVLAIALGAALGSAKLFGVSLAIGAFFAGMILAESELSQRAAQETLPLRDAFAVLFFVSVGMIFNPSILVESPLALSAVVFIIVIARPAIVVLIARAFGYPVETGIAIGAARAPIGEFSFILGSLGVSLGLIPERGQDLIVAGALISIVLGPLLLWLVAPLERRRAAPQAPAEARRSLTATTQNGAGESPASASPSEPEIENAGAYPAPASTKAPGQTIIVGYGVVGKAIAAEFQSRGRACIVIDQAETRVAEARAAGFDAVLGNAANEDLLDLAGIGDAQTLFVAIPEPFDAGAVVASSRRLNARLVIVARAHSESEDAHFRGLGADAVILGAHEIAAAMARRAPPPSG